MVGKIKGLTTAEVEASREANGNNALIKEKTKGFFKRFFESLSDPIIKVLIFAVILEVVVTLGKCNWLEVGGIVVAVLIATTVSVASEYGSERAFSKMQEESRLGAVRVFRNGEVCSVSSDDIVVGDIVFLSAGEVVPADCSVLEGSFTADQSALNGESQDAKKKRTNGGFSSDLMCEGAVFRGSVVTSGEGVVRVEKIGVNTYYGKVARDVQSETRESPLKLRLGKLASQISRLGYIMAGIVGLTYLFFAYVVDNGYDLEKILDSLHSLPYVVTTLTHALTLMITVVVVAVPEGLPMMITVVLSANMNKMVKDNVMVKKLVGIETAGSMNILFTDKTGTLTTGKTACDRIITVSGSYKSASAMRKEENMFHLMNVCAKFSSESRESANSTDRAIHAFFRSEECEGARIISRIPFTSDKKYSAIELASGERIIKGAPELILSKCGCAINKRGEKISADLADMEKEYIKSASAGQRIIAVAKLEANSRELCFMALVILKDKVRRGVVCAVESVKRAGVQVVMITGDGKETASAIAEECGILKNPKTELVLSREELENMTDEELTSALPRLRVVSRALPSDKTRLVRIAQGAGLVVGMTGDGINDAPSLKLADVGFCMGSGTDIAKAAGDIIILDDSFESIGKTVLYGRTIFKSIRKFITFQLMMNIAACGVSLLGQFIGIDNPITIIQMLWINIIMDTLGGLAFSGEPALDYYMMEKPKSREEKILTRDMLHQIVFTGGYTLALCISFLFFGGFRALFRESAGNVCFLTGFYALFVFSGIFNCLNSRSERLWMFSNIGKNKLFLLIMLSISVIQILMIYFGGEVFRCVPLSFRELLTVILLSATVLPFDMIRRFFKKLS